jgi:hypothetical protein
MGMTDEMHHDDEPLTPAELAAAASYHAPPDIVPREAMWDAIRIRRGTVSAATTPAAPTLIGETPTAPAIVGETQVTVMHTTRSALRRIPRWIALASAAAVVVIAINLSRRSAITMPPATVTIDSAANSVAWQTASSEHFGMAESMLTTLSNSPQQNGDAQLTAWSRDLLESTRLLIDSPAGRDPKRRALLMELELVLVQLVESGPTMRTDDRTMMDDLLSRSALLLTRIRTTVPAGMPTAHNQ